MIKPPKLKSIPILLFALFISSAFSYGRVTASRNTFNYMVLPAPPTITSFSPSSGPVGTLVTISGINFNADASSNIVFFGATRATVTESTTSVLTVRVPEGATYQPISVLNTSNQLKGHSTTPFIVTFNPNNNVVGKENFFLQLDLSPASTSAAEMMSMGDLDGDGKLDLVSGNSDAGGKPNISIFRNTATAGPITAASFDSKIELPLNATPGGLVISDLDGDGKPELTVLDGLDRISIFRNISTNGVIAFAAKMDLSIANCLGISVGDIDGDGKPDLVVSARKTTKVFIFQNISTSGNIAFANPVTAVTYPAAGPESVAIGDFDGDGKADLAVVNKVSGLISVFRNLSANGTMALGPAVVLTPGEKPENAAIGDFDDDGKLDLVVTNSKSGSISVFHNTSSGSTISFASKLDFTGDAKVKNLAITDLDGDGKVDIVTAAFTNTGTISLYRNIHTRGALSSSSFTQKQLLTPFMQDISVGDIDGDGRPDIAGTNGKVITVLRYNPFQTKINNSYAGTTLTNIDSAIRAVEVPLANSYRFRVTEGANVQTIDVQTFSFKLTELATYAYSTAYKIDVQVQAGGIWSDYGTSTQVSSPAPLTKLSTVFCGKVIADINTPITADHVPLASSYRFRITQGAEVQTFEGSTNSFTLSQLSNHAPNNSFSVDVQVLIGSTWSSYGTACSINTPIPVTQLNSASRGITLTNIDDAITADEVSMANAYRFRASYGSTVQTIEVPTNSFKLSQFANGAYNTVYSIDLQVKMGENWSDYGTAYQVTSPAVLLTRVFTGLCGTAISSSAAPIDADLVPFATTYRFRITKGSSVQTIDVTTNSFALSQLGTYDLNTSYTVDVAAETGGVWGAYGASCEITTPLPGSQISASFRGQTLAHIDSAIRADEALMAIGYRFRVTKEGAIQTIDAETNSFKITQLAEYAYNSTYSIDVAVKIGSTWGSFGTAYNIITPLPSTQLSELFRGKTLANVDTVITADPVPLASSYRFRVTNGSSIQTLDTETNSFNVTEINNYAYETEYGLDVAVEVQGRMSAFGTSNFITTPVPATKVSGLFCGTTLDEMISVIYADNAPLATMYRYRVIGGDTTQILETPYNHFRLIHLAKYDYNTAYNIDVQVQVDSTWSAYGEICTVTSPGIPLVQVWSSICGTVLPSMEGIIRSTGAPMATAYEFKVTEGGIEQILSETLPLTILGKLNSYKYNTTYSIQVRSKVHGNWTAYGPACNVTTSPTITQVAEAFDGKTLDEMITVIYADVAPKATSYRFRVIANDTTQVVETTLNNFRLIHLPKFTYNTMYTIDVDIKLGDVWIGYGTTRTVYSPGIPSTQVSRAFCGVVLTTDGLVRSDSPPLATQFEFKVTEGANTQVIVETFPLTLLSKLNFYKYNTIYSIQVRAMVNNSWTPFGAACNVTTSAPITQVSASFCGSTLTTRDGQIMADNLAFATAYRFKITQGSKEEILESNTTLLTLNKLSFYAYSSTYSVQVSAMVDSVWYAYGAACNITTIAPLTNANLSALVVSTGTLNQSFNAGTLNYTASVGNSVTSVTLKPTVQDATATIKINDVRVINASLSGSISLRTGPNIISTVVTAQDSSTVKTYTLTITRDSSANANLSALVLSSGILDPVFDAAKLSYNATVPNAINSITLIPSRADTTATIEVNGILLSSGSASGNIALSIGVNTITTLVTAEDGRTLKTYTVTVIRDSSANANLSALALSSGILDPVFDAAILSYNATVTNATNYITVISTTADSTATVKVNGVLVSSGTASGNINLVTGANTLRIAITAQDGRTVKTYVVNIIRDSSPDATLTALALSAGTLDPVFDAAKLSYTATVPNTTSSITLNPTAADPTATVKVNGTLLSNGTASPNINLLYGANILNVEVKAADGITAKNYILTVNRLASADASLSGISLSSGNLNPIFSASTISYTAFADNITSVVNVGPLSTDPEAIVKVNGELNTHGSATRVELVVGSNLVAIAVLSSNGSVAKTYILNITRVNSGQVLLDNTGGAIINNTTTQVLITSASNPIALNVPVGISSPSINYDYLITNGQGTIPQTKVNTSFSQLTIPPATMVTASNTSWNGVLLTPSITTYTLPPVTGQVITPGLIIEVGSQEYSLSFDKAVRLALIGQAGMRIARVHNNVYSEISLTGLEDSQAAGDALPADGSFKINSGTDMIIWTKVFSKYISYSQKTDLNVALADADKAELTAELIKLTNPALSTVGSPLLLPTTGSFGSTISWVSSKPNVVSPSGNILFRPLSGSGNISVTLTATITKGLITQSKSFDIVVNELPNQPPGLAALSKQLICLNTNEQIVVLSGINAGPESAQTTSIRVSSDTPAMFNLLSILNGELHYRVNANAIGSANITVTVKDNGGTTNGGIDTFSQTFTLTINPLPDSQISSSLGAEISKGTTAILSVPSTQAGTSFLWANTAGILGGHNSPELSVRPDITTTYTLTITNSTGCVAVQSFTLNVIDDFKALTINNVLTPNGDGKNDFLVIKNLDMYPSNTLIIFDQAGREIFRKVNYQNDWDGSFQGSPLTEETYYYIVDFGSGKIKIKGNVSIIR